MAEREDLSPDTPGSGVSRRSFLITSGAGLTGLAFSPLVAGHAAEPRDGFPIVNAVVKLAQALSSRVLGTNIVDYVRRRDVPSATEQEVYRINRRMAEDRGRFTDLSASTVYSPEGYYFFYPARSEDRFNSCVAFFDQRRAAGEQLIAVIEGPTLFGIGMAAQDAQSEESAAYARRIFLPRNVSSQGTGSWNSSYAQPDIYQTEAGYVRANYTTNGNGKGTVTVRARNERGELLRSGDYELTFS